MSFSLELQEAEGELQGHFRTAFGDGRKFPTHDTKEFLKTLSDSRPGHSGVLPPVTRFISDNGRSVILERPPQMMTIRYSGVRAAQVEDATEQEYTVGLPWTVYGISLNGENRPVSTAVFASRGPLQGLKDQLFLLPLANYEVNGWFCVPAVPDDGKPWTVAEGINASYTRVWDSNFNTDITSVIDRSYDYRLPSAIFERAGKGPIKVGARISAANLLKRWSEFSLDEVTAWTDWLPAAPDYDVRRLIGDVTRYRKEYNMNYLFNNLRAKLG